MGIRTTAQITKRQLEVIKLLAHGLSNDEISDTLSISPRTAKAHCDAIRRKLGVHADAISLSHIDC